MNILFLSYWGVNEGLTVSTVYPHLKILSSFESIQKIVFCTIERDGVPSEVDLAIDKVVHKTLVSKKRAFTLLTKTEDFTVFPRQLSEWVKHYSIDHLICRGAPAGALGYLVHRKTGVPYYVESFEPHADYMLESGVWKKYDPRYLTQYYFEQKQLKTSLGLMPVADNYKKLLISKGIEEKRLKTMPCAVPVEQFAFQAEERDSMREALNIRPGEVAGVYVGKFGDIYYDEEAFAVFQKTSEFFNGKFKLIILTPNDREKVKAKAKSAGLDADKLIIDFRPHKEIPSYLSASDFAFATIKPAPSKKYCSPIKNGEYWANGLPVLLTEGIGDDSDTIEKEGAGAVFSLEKDNLLNSLTIIRNILSEPGHRKNIMKVAEKYRSFAVVKEAYQYYLF